MNAESEIAALKIGAGQRPQAEGISFTAIGPCAAEDMNLAARHATWRNNNRDAFRSSNQTNATNTARWLAGIAADQPRRLIFELGDSKTGIPFGAIGVSSPTENSNTWYLEGVLRGSSGGPPGAMGLCVSAVCNWCGSLLNATAVRANCFADQIAALTTYHRCGFRPVELIPLVPVKIDGGIRWDSAPDQAKPERYFVVMEWKAETN